MSTTGDMEGGVFQAVVAEGRVQPTDGCAMTCVGAGVRVRRLVYNQYRKPVAKISASLAQWYVSSLEVCRFTPHSLHISSDGAGILGGKRPKVIQHNTVYILSRDETQLDNAHPWTREKNKGENRAKCATKNTAGTGSAITPSKPDMSVPSGATCTASPSTS